MLGEPGVRIRIAKDPGYDADLKELSLDFPDIDTVDDAIDWRFQREPEHGTILPKAKVDDHFVHRSKGVAGYPTYRYLFERRFESGDYAIRLIGIALVHACEND